MVQIYLISGFLGAGKTTLLNRMLAEYADRKLAVIVNEYGDIGVDGKLIKESTMSIKEINGGSIFCTCRSDHFIDAIKTIGESDINTIIVENSGLANPNSMSKIMDVLEILSPNRFKYAGSICVVDCSTIEKVLTILPVAKSQIESSQIIILNKVDLIDAAQLQSATENVNSINYEATIVTASYCDFNSIGDLLLLDSSKALSNRLSTKALGISKFTLSPNNLSLSGLTEWLKFAKSYTLRIKGFISIDNKTHVIQSTLSDYRIEPFGEDVPNGYLEIIMKSNDLKKNEIVSYWEAINEKGVRNV